MHLLRLSQFLSREVLWPEAGQVIYIQKNIMANEKTEPKKHQQVK